jgi:hypothetical protein
MSSNMNKGQFKITSVDIMEGFPFALKYFDDDMNIFVSPSVYKEIENGKAELRFVMMSWRADQISIEDAVQDIIERVKEYGMETGQIN